MGVRKRIGEADYLDVSAQGSDPEWALCGTGFTALSESPSAQTSSKKYINQTSATQSVSGYEWSASFEADQIKEEPVLKCILNIAKKLLTGNETEKQYLQVDLDDPVTTEGATNTFRARKRTIAIAVSELPDNDGELGVTGDFLGVSDPVEGTFDTKTRTFTAVVK